MREDAYNFNIAMRAMRAAISAISAISAIRRSLNLAEMERKKP